MKARRRKPRARLGRPPAAPGTKRSQQLKIWVTPAFEARVHLAAAAAKMSVSDWGLGVLVTALSEPEPTT